MYKVAVLLSTYNGEKYICELIDSVLKQKNVDVELYIRDDGSTDQTVNLIRTLNSPNIVIMEGENIGASNSFCKLLHNIPKRYDYYAFSDQDDVWDEMKLSVAISKLIEYDKNVPNLYYSNLNYVDETLQLLRKDVCDRKRNFEFSLIRSLYPGCTMVFNWSTLEVVQKQEVCCQIMHDQFIFQIVSGLEGNIYYDANSYISYRIHGNNVSDYGNIGKRIKQLWKYLTSKKNIRIRALLELNQKYGQYFSKRNKDILDQYCNYIRMNVFGRFMLGIKIPDSFKYKIMCAVLMSLKKF